MDWDLIAADEYLSGESKIHKATSNLRSKNRKLQEAIDEIKPLARYAEKFFTLVYNEKMRMNQFDGAEIAKEYKQRFANWLSKY